MAVNPQAPLHIKDKFGNDLYFGNFGDFWSTVYPLADYRQHLKDVKQLEMRPDDTIVIGYPKSGGHWLFEIVKMLRGGTGELGDPSEVRVCLEGTPVSMVPPTDKPRIFFSHVRPKYLPKQVWEKKVKVVYHVRNPKDTWVSYFTFMSKFRLGTEAASYGGTWDQFFELMMDMGFYYGDWFDYNLDWEMEIEANSGTTGLQVITTHFEDLKKNPVEEIVRIDKCLDTNRGREFCEKVAKACEFSSMKKVREEQFPDVVKQMFTDGVPLFYRKGEIGDWKNWFTPTQNERFDAEYEKRMAGSKLKFTFK